MYICLSHVRKDLFAKHTWIEWFERCKNLVLQEGNEREEQQLEVIVNKLKFIIYQQ